MDWITTVNGLIALITALCGLVGTGISAFFAIRTLIKSRKEKTVQENWAFICEVAKKAMSKAEELGKTGADKKTMVIEIVRETCKASGIDIDAFLDQLSAFIDDSIAFANTIK